MEELTLILEEMRRVDTYFERRAIWWESRCSLRSGLKQDLMDGIRAYSGKQAHVNRELRRSFQSLWRAEVSSIHGKLWIPNGDDVEGGDEGSEGEAEATIM